MAKRTNTSDGAVTGIASGSLGTGTALDDTQVYEVDAPGTGEALGAEDVAPASLVGAEAGAVTPPAAAPRPAPPQPPVSPGQSAPVTRLRPRSRTTGGYPVGILAAAAIALVVVAGLLTLRDGSVFGGGAGSNGIAGPASFPPAPSFGAVATPPPQPTPVDHGHDHGHGHGH